MLERAAEIQPDHAGASALLSDAYDANKRHWCALVAAARALRLGAQVSLRITSAWHNSTRHSAGRTRVLYHAAQRADTAAQSSRLACPDGVTPAPPGHCTCRAERARKRGAARAIDHGASLHAGAPARREGAHRRGQGRDGTSAAAIARFRAPGIMSLGQRHQQLGVNTSGLEYHTELWLDFPRLSPTIGRHWRSYSSAVAYPRPHARDTGARVAGDYAPMHLAIGTLFEGQSSHDFWRSGTTKLPRDVDAQSAEHWLRLGRARRDFGDHESLAIMSERA